MLVPRSSLIRGVTVAMLAASPSPTPSSPVPAPMLIDWSRPETAAAFLAVDDRIMGGASTSSVVHEDGDTIFQGNLIVEGGGFASVRYMPAVRMPKDADALLLDAKGDGRMGYKLTLQSATAPDGVSYQYQLPALSDAEYLTLRLPLSEFRATFRGRPAPDAPPLRAADVCSLGLMLSRYEVAGGVKESIPAGGFRLRLRGGLRVGESELAINGRRWVKPRGGAPRAGVIVSRAGLPEELEARLPAAARKERAAVVPLYKAVRQCYPSEEAALEALQRSPALCYPWACSVGAIKGSYQIIVDLCGREVALDVITKNPGVTLQGLEP